LVVSLVVSWLLADDKAGFAEFLQPTAAKLSAIHKVAAEKTARTADDDLDVVDIGGLSFATRLRVLDTSDESHTNSASTDIT
jgi:hypothetical protein